MINQDHYSRASKKELLKRLAMEDDTAALSGESTPEISVPEPQQEEKKKFNFVLFLKYVLSLAFIGAIGFSIYYFRSQILAFFRPKPTYIGAIASSTYTFDTQDVPSLENRCVKNDGVVDPEIAAQSYYVIFADSFQQAAAKSQNSRVSFASITKLLGMLVSLEHYDLEDEFVLLQAVDTQANGLELEVGEGVKVRDLIAASVIGSKNDAMFTLAQNFPGGELAFVDAMNEKADELGLKNTHVVNPVGYDDDGQYSTPHDIAILSVAAMRNPVIRGFAAESSYTLVTSTGRSIEFSTTNGLIGQVDGVIGLKTGYTEAAGMCLVSYVDDAQDFVAVVMNAEDRVEESRKLIEWVRSSYICTAE